MAWMEQYLSGLYPPCVVDWLPNDATEIKAFDRFFVINVDGNNSDPGVRVSAVFRLRCFPREGFRSG